MPTITIHGVDELEKRLGKIAAKEALREPMQQSLLLLERRMKEYPRPPAPGEWAAKTTPAQKRAFFALLRAGMIDGGRTGTLGRRWTRAITDGIVGLEGRLGNNTRYGPYVQDERWQASFHRGRWQTAQEVVREETARIVRFFTQAIARALE